MTHGNETATAYIDDNGNMVVILVALLCALICALGLNSVVRCLLRCTRVIETDADLEAAGCLSLTGFKKDLIGKIPMVVYKPGMDIPATDCPICLGEFEEGEDVRILPRCNHGFHVECIDTWLVRHLSCPTCRQQLVGSFASSSW